MTPAVAPAEAARGPADLSPALVPYAYRWPRADSMSPEHWHPAEDPRFLMRELPEAQEQVAHDSRWPALFSSPIALVTTGGPGDGAIEKVVGVSIVNRFPYVMAVSLCRTTLSERHYARAEFGRRLESCREAVVQFVAPGSSYDRLMHAIAALPDEACESRLAAAEAETRPGRAVSAPVLREAYLAYEGRLVGPGRDITGARINPTPYADVGSHRVYYLEIRAVQLRRDIANGACQIHWRSLPAWIGHAPRRTAADFAERRRGHLAAVQYQKSYTPDYRFPSAATVAFEADEEAEGMAVKHLPPLPEDQVEVDNDRARWPCFFPSSVGMITAWAGDVPTIMPCGSTTVVSRQPFVISPCISYSEINERYAPRASLEVVTRSGRFGCGLPFIDAGIVDAIAYLGNVSGRHDRDKFVNGGLTPVRLGRSPATTELPVHFDCRVVGHRDLGTHRMLFGEVERIYVRRDLTAETPLEWCPIAEVTERAGRR